MEWCDRWMVVGGVNEQVDVVGHDAEGDQAVAFAIQGMDLFSYDAGDVFLRQPVRTFGDAEVEPGVDATEVFFSRL